jgi:hypothetical protein
MTVSHDCVTRVHVHSWLFAWLHCDDVHRQVLTKVQRYVTGLTLLLLLLLLLQAVHSRQ